MNTRAIVRRNWSSSVRHFVIEIRRLFQNLN